MATYDPAESHDQNIKTIIVENPWDAITFAMPKCTNFFKHEPEIIDIREETTKIYFADSYLRMDVPLLVKYEDLAFTFLIEHNHDPHKFSIHQLSRYTSYLEERHERNVIPIVYFTNASAKNVALKREIKSTFMGKRYHYFTYEAVFLKDKPAKKYLKSDNIIARLLLPFMRYSKDDWLEVLDSALKAVWELVAPSEGLRQNKYLDFLAYYFNLGEREWEAYSAYKQEKKEQEEFEMITNILREQLRAQVTQQVTEQLRAQVTQQVTEQLRAQITQQVTKQAEATGKLNEGRHLLLLMLPKRLGPMPPEIESAIRSLTDLDRIHFIMAQLMEIRDWQEVKQLLQDE